MKRSFAYLAAAVFLIILIGCSTAVFENRSASMHSEERQLVGVWRLLRSEQSNDDRETTVLMILNPDRTWFHASYPGKEELPCELRETTHGRRWACFRGDFRQYVSPPEEGGTILYRRKVLSLTQNMLRMEVWKKPWLQPYVYVRVTGPAETHIKKLLAKTNKSTPVTRRTEGDAHPLTPSLLLKGITK